MENTVFNIKSEKEAKLAIGLMSGTSLDGIDAALVEINGSGLDTGVRLIDFITLPFTEETRAHILSLADGKSTNMEEVCRMNMLIGELCADACEEVIRKAGINKEDIAFVGSHGQTVWHEPIKVDFLGKNFNSTLQIGDSSPIAERLNTIVVSDFRVRDVAAGGTGAPLVPYTEFILYNDKERNVALQNIGGIGNITILKKGCNLDEVFAFDTGPGNMLIDGCISYITEGRLSFDKGGKLAEKGSPNKELLNFIIENDDYIRLSPPKNSGRERYGSKFLEKIINKSIKLGVTNEDLLATVTNYTAYTIYYSVKEYCKLTPDRLIVGGGGANNLTLMSYIRKYLPDTEVITNEDLGLSGDAKEAVAFAVLANDCIYGKCNNAPKATGALHPVVMGKITR